jgi:hypothetical protein
VIPHRAVIRRDDGHRFIRGAPCAFVPRKQIAGSPFLAARRKPQADGSPFRENDSRNQFLGDDTVSETKLTLKQRAYRGAREYLIISLYLFVVFGLFAIYKSVILAEQNIDYEPQGWALINALALGKVVIIAQELHFAENFRGAPLIYPTLLKSFAFTIVLACFKIVEEAVVGMWIHGKSFQDSIATIGGSWKGILSLTVLLFVVLIPFFGFTELQRVFGERLVGAFFRPRHLLNLPPVES